MDWLAYIANAFIFVAAVCITMAPRYSLRPHLFVLFLVGHLLWLVVACYRPDIPLILLNFFFCTLDSFAIWVRVSHFPIEERTAALLEAAKRCVGA